MSISIFEKTLRYNLSLDANPADVANNTTTTIGSNTIYIPENEPGKPVNITSALVYFTHQDTSTVTGATISNLNVSATINAVATSTITDANSLANTGENWSALRGPYNFTNYVNTNWGGTSDSASFSVAVTCNITTGTGVTTRANYAWIELTYEYSASAANRGQTICYPLPQANTGSLPSPSPTFFSTIPQLTGVGGLFEGYNSFEILDSYIEIRANYCVSNQTTDTTINYFISADSPQNLPTRENALASDTYCSYHIPYPAASGSSSNTLNLGCDVASRFANPVVYLWITGQYIESGTTEYINTLSFPIEITSLTAGTNDSQNVIYNKTLRIAEPNPITYLTGNIQINGVSTTNPSIFTKIGNESSYKRYSYSIVQSAGQNTLSHYISSSFIQFGTGSNDIPIYLYESNFTNISGLCNILYKSPIYVSGSDYHTKNVTSLLREYTNSPAGNTNNLLSSLSLIEPHYQFHSVYNVLNFQHQLINQTFVYSFQQLSSENYGQSYIDVYIDRANADSEISWMNVFCPLRDFFKRFPGDMDINRLEVSQSRNYRVINDGASMRYGSWWAASYHCITYSVHGNISNSDGGTVTIELFRSSNDELLQRTTRSGDGTFSFRVYDQEEYYLTAYENENFKGMSRISRPDNTFDISLSGGGGGGTSEHSYTWIG